MSVCYNEYFRECLYSLQILGNMRIPQYFQRIHVFLGFVKQLLHIFNELKLVNMCYGLSLKYYTRNAHI